MEKISIKNSYKEKLAGIFYKHSGSKKLIIVCHGRLTNKDQYFIPELCKKINKSGFNAYRFDFSGNGQSWGKFEECTITKDVKDIKSVVKFFKGKNYEVYCLIGHSMGAVEVLLHQAKYNSAKRIVDIAGLVNQKDMTANNCSKDQIKELNKKGFFKIKHKGKYFNISKKYFCDRLSYGDIRKFVKKIKTPVLVVHGTKDEEIGFNNSKLMIRSLNKKSKMAAIKGAGHFFDYKKHRNEMMRSIIKWLKNE